MLPKKRCFLYLESGLCFEGTHFGHEGEAFGEVVFNTGMTGYQEILTDPSYKNQMIVFTYPEIGNYGIHLEDNESPHVHASAMIVKHYNSFYSHPKAIKSLAAFLKEHKIIGLQEVDTRKLVKVIRDQGAQKAVITTEKHSRTQLIQKARSGEAIMHLNLVKKVTTPQIYSWTPQNTQAPSRSKHATTIGVIDYGTKRNILQELYQRDCHVIVFPADTLARDLLAYVPRLQGILLSNGPGDPRALPEAVKECKQLIGKIPLFGICFGHQILGQALGMTIDKLTFGHRGSNQPVQDKNATKVQITSQNHSFVLRTASENASHQDMLSAIHLNDHTISGIDRSDKYLFSVQYHPEASPGPHDAKFLFDRFLEMIKKFEGSDA